MREKLRDRLLDLLRVPVEPAPPPGDPRLVRTFRAAPSYFRYKVAMWALTQIGAAAGLLFSYFFFRNFVWPGGGYLRIIEQLAIVGFIAQLPFSYALLRLDFEMRWYILSDRSLRIRHGILAVHEQTMTFANIQNISIRQNPLQRLFGIATVAVRAAGGGGGSPSQKGGKVGSGGSHEATFEGVADAEQIRSAIRERVRRYADAGLGDPDEVNAVTTAAADRHVAADAADRAGLRSAIEAAHRVLAEATQLRGSLEKGGARG